MLEYKKHVFVKIDYLHRKVVFCKNITKIVQNLQSTIKFIKCFSIFLLVTMIHASLRMRGIRNKLTNKLETSGLRRTPMGIILDGLGQEAEIAVQG